MGYAGSNFRSKLTKEKQCGAIKEILKKPLIT